MITQAEKYAAIAANVVIKVPINLEGLQVVKALAGRGIKTNVTLIFSSSQALLAAKAGATYVSPFVGRIDDISGDGMALVEDIAVIYDNYDIATEIIVALGAPPAPFRAGGQDRGRRGHHSLFHPFTASQPPFDHHRHGTLSKGLGKGKVLTDEEKNKNPDRFFFILFFLGGLITPQNITSII